MATTPLNAFTALDYMQLAAREFAQVAAIPTSGTPTTLLFTCLSTTAIVLLSQAVATTTGTAAINSKALTVASGTSIAIGQLVSGAGIAPGTTVAAISGTAVTLSIATTAALNSAAVNFVASVSIGTGIAVTPNWPLPLVIGSNTFISYISANGGSPAYGGFPSSGFTSLINVVAGS